MLTEPNCHKRGCKHFAGVVGEDEQQQVVVCPAFPHGIPSDIAYGDNLHLEVMPGQQGTTVYESSTPWVDVEWELKVIEWEAEQKAYLHRLKEQEMRDE